MCPVAGTAGVMTLLRRAPREVYRVYEEDEFFADAVHEERFGSTISDAGEGRVRRIAGAAMLLGAVGVVGGLVVVNSLPPARGPGRRALGGLRAKSRSLAPAHVASARMWSAFAASVRPRRATKRGSRPIGAGRRPRNRIRSTEVAAARPSVDAAAVTEGRANGTPLAVSARVIPQPVGHAEFGFER